MSLGCLCFTCKVPNFLPRDPFIHLGEERNTCGVHSGSCFRKVNETSNSLESPIFHFQKDSALLPNKAVWTAATAAKPSLENITSLYLYNFAIIPVHSICTMWANYPVTERVGKPFKIRQRMKDLPSSATRSPQHIVRDLQI